MKNAFAIVVTFNPSTAVLANVAAHRTEGLRVLVVDNTEGPSSVVAELERAGAEVIRNGVNLGVATALNVGVRLAGARGAEWIFTFDQDSRIVPGFASAMVSAWPRAVEQFGDVGVLAPAYRDQKSGRMLSRGTEGSELTLLEDTMTSGNLLRPETFRRVGGYADDYFIDYVDTEFCLRCRAAGLRIVRVNAAVLDHNLGDTRWFDIFGVPFKVCEQSPLRRYYMMRNRTRTYLRFAGAEPRWFLEELRRVGLEEVKMLLFERQRSRKLVNQARGLLDAARGKSGPLR